MATETITETWPTLAELRAVGKELDAAEGALDALASRLNRLVDADFAPSLEDGAPRPTLADVGALTYIVEQADLILGLAQDGVRRIRRVRDAMAHECEEVWNDG